MTTGHIDSGPRYTKMKVAIRRSVSALQRPLTPVDIAAGWSDELRTLMVNSYEQVLAEISRGLLEARHYKNWVKGLDHIDLTDRHAVQLLEDALAGERAIRGVRRAEGFLSEVLEFLAFLSEPATDEATQSDLSHMTRMVAVVMTVADRLQSGEYLQSEDFWAWDALVSEFGCKRPRVNGGPRAKDLRHSVTAVSPLESTPNGIWWERITAFDVALVNFASEDLSRE
jgi:hypothetical protein